MVAATLKDAATELDIRFQPFQLYPDLPSTGVPKGEFFLHNSKRVRPKETDEGRIERRKGVVEAWAADGLELRDVYGSLEGSVLGNSLDSQRLILLAREQGKEDAFVEELYAMSHVHGANLGSWKVLTTIAEAAGVSGALTALETGSGEEEVQHKIEYYRGLGLNSVPVLIIDNQFIIQGAPEVEQLRNLFANLLNSSDEPSEGS